MSESAKDVDHLLANLRALIDNLPSAVLVEDENRRIVYLNQQFCDLFGIPAPPSDLVGVDCSRSASESARLFANPDGFLGRIPRLLEDRKIVRNEEIDLADGRTVERDYVPIFADGAFVGHLWNYRDVTARKNLERQLQERLIHADRLASVGQLAAGVAHEINNPAAYVVINLSTIERNIDVIRSKLQTVFSAYEAGDESSRASALGGAREVEHQLGEVRKLLRDNIDGMNHIRSVTRSLQSFSRIERNEVELVQINDVVEATGKMVTNEIRYRAGFVKDLGQDIPPVAADRGKLSQALLNLLTNAAHAIEEGRADENQVTVRTFTEGDSIVVAVDDTGEGIADGDVEKIFQPFFTNKPRDRGTGLGLALAAEVVRMHGGQISFKTEPGEGSHFAIRLPFETGLTVTSQPPTERPVVSGSRAARVLLIDDEPAICSAYEALLGQHHDVVVAHGGHAALAVLDTDTDFDVILCDLMMPKVDGTQIFERIAEVAPSLTDRIVFCTGGAFTPKAKRFTSNLKNPVLQKPVDPQRLLTVIDQVASRADTHPRQGD